MCSFPGRPFWGFGGGVGMGQSGAESVEKNRMSPEMGGRLPMGGQQPMGGMPPNMLITLPGGMGGMIPPGGIGRMMPPGGMGMGMMHPGGMGMGMGVGMGMGKK